MKPARPAFTLLEVMISCAIVSIILLATQSAIILLARTVPDGKTGPSARLAAAKTLDMIAGDLRWATSISKDTATEIIFTVPDRNGDGVPETIRYVWSGNAGDSLYRQFNGGGSVSISDNVRTFSLTYDSGTASISGGTTTSAETLLASYPGSLLPLPTSTNLDVNNGVGEFFMPALPSNAVSWGVTRILVYAAGIQTPNQVICTLYSESCGLPSTAVTSYQTPQLGSGFSWVTLPVAASGIDPHTAACFQIQGVNSKATAAIESQNPGPAANLGACDLLKTTNGGTTWTAPANQSLLFYVYGTYTTAAPAVSQNVLQGVRCTLQAGNDSATSVASDIRLYNTPVIP